jgi:hypothetical protein
MTPRQGPTVRLRCRPRPRSDAGTSPPPDGCAESPLAESERYHRPSLGSNIQVEIDHRNRPQIRGLWILHG